MRFEDDIAKLNEHFFFREFTFSKTTFRPTPGSEVELADNILWLDDLLVVFQLKERVQAGTSTSEKEARWFDRKVIALGSRQIRDTLMYLVTHKRIELQNHRGHLFHLDSSAIAKIHKVVCYSAQDNLPSERNRKKFHRSRTAGVIHVIPAHDYVGILKTLLTPPELSDYLRFREELIERWGNVVETLPEQALVGQYLRRDVDSRPNAAFIEYLGALEHRIDEWDMSGIIKQFPDRVTTKSGLTDYHGIITEIAKLKRNELREFKQRFQLSMEKCRANEFAQPYRMASPRTRCGFVFIPLQKAFIEHRLQGLQNLTYACKYDLRLEKCLGASFAPEDSRWYTVEWCYMSFPWEFDPELDIRLKEHNPFREVRSADLGGYTFKVKNNENL